jgi:hypothetical protein
MPFPEPAKVNFSLSTMYRHNWGAEVDHSFVTSARDGGEWLTASSSCFAHKIEPSTHWLGGPQTQSGHSAGVKNLLPLLGYELPDSPTCAVQCFSLHKDTTPPQLNHTVTPTHIEPEQYNTWNKSTISRKFLKMDVLTFETWWAVNSEIIKQVTSSWSVFIQLSIWCMVQ